MSTLSRPLELMVTAVCCSHPFLLEGGAFDQPYRMVQPALAIVDR